MAGGAPGNVAQVLDIELQAVVLVHPQEDRAVDPGEARQGHCVGDRGEHVALMHNTQAEGEPRRDLDLVPERGGEIRGQGGAAARRRSCGLASDPGGLDRQCGHGLPPVGDLAAEPELQARAPLGAGLNDATGVERIRRLGVLAVQTVGCASGHQARTEVDLEPGLQVLEGLGLEGFGGEGKARELVARSRQAGHRIAGVDRQELDRPDHDAQPGGPDPVSPRKVPLARHRGPLVALVQAEDIVAQAGDELDPGAKVSLDLAEGRRHICDAGVVPVGTGVGVGDDQVAAGRVLHGDPRQGRRPRRTAEAAGLAKITGLLPTQLHPRHDRPTRALPAQGPDHVGLAEQVGPLGEASVGLQGVGRGLALGVGHRGARRVDIAIALVVAAPDRPVAQGQVVTERQVESQPGGVGLHPGPALGGIAEIGADGNGEGPALEGRCPAVRGAVIDETLEGQGCCAPSLRLVGRRGVHPPAFDIDEVAIAAGTLVQQVDPAGKLIGQGGAEVTHHPPVLEVTTLEAEADMAAAIGHPGDTIDHAAPAAPAKDHGVGTQQHLDALGIVEVAVVLDVIADAIDEEVRRGGIAPQAWGIAVPLALADGGTRNVAQDIGHGLHGLVPDQLGRHHPDGLRDVPEFRGDAKGRVEPAGQIALLGWRGDDQGRDLRGHILGPRRTHAEGEGCKDEGEVPGTHNESDSDANENDNRS